MNRRRVIVASAVATLLLVGQRAGAHCDTMDGPVVADARLALQTKRVVPVLKWVSADNEKAIKAAFGQALAAREKSVSTDTDTRFFETLIRVHREGEGAPFTGLKAAGEGVTPALRAADKALETGSVQEVLKLVEPKLAPGVQQRFNVALQKRKLADTSVKAGREYVAAYVDYVHFIEGESKVAGDPHAKSHEQHH